MYYYRNLQSGTIVSLSEGGSLDWNVWEQITQREYENSNTIAALRARVAELEEGLDTMTMLFAQVQRDAETWDQYRKARELLNKDPA